MAIPDVFTLAEFADLLKVPEGAGAFEITPNDETTGLGNGQMLTAEFFPPVWRVSIETVPIPSATARGLASVARAIQHKGKSFMLCDASAKYPQLDPMGIVVGGASVTINAVGGEGRSIKLQGQPSLYQLRPGDRFSVTDAGRTYYGEVQEDSNADVNGVGPFVDVFPQMPLWVVAGMPVTLAKPAARMRIVPATLKIFNGLVNSTIAFDAVEWVG